MDDNIYLVLNYNTICRLCLRSNGIMSNIFENNGGTSTIEQIFLVTGIYVERDDGFPTNICYKCRYIVEQSSELREMAKKTQKLLSDGANTNNMLLEHINDGRGEKETKNDCELIQQNDTELMELNEMNTLSNITNRTIIDEVEIESHNNDKKKRVPKSLQCQICLDYLKNKQQVILHIVSHYKESDITPYLELKRPYECEVCKTGSMSKKNLIEHHRNHLNVNPYVCKHPGCSYVGKNQDNLRHHTIIHGARMHACEHCGLVFRRRSELRQHTLRRHAARPVACRLCRAVCRNTLAYRVHYASHYNKPKYACAWRGCPKSFRSRAALATHERAHGRDARHRCRLCPAAYTSQSLLNRHLRQHDRLRLRKCDKCPLTFEEYGAFYSHRVAAHGPWLPYRCPACNYRYNSEAQLKKHLAQCKLAAHMREYEAGAAELDGTSQQQAGEVIHPAEGAQIVG